MFASVTNSDVLPKGELSNFLMFAPVQQNNYTRMQSKARPVPRLTSMTLCVSLYFLYLCCKRNNYDCCILRIKENEPANVIEPVWKRHYYHDIADTATTSVSGLSFCTCMQQMYIKTLSYPNSFSLVLSTLRAKRSGDLGTVACMQ